MNLHTRLLKISTDGRMTYDTHENNYTFSLLEVEIDLFLTVINISIAYWFTKESHEQRLERINAFLHEYFLDSHLEEEPKPKRKYVKKEDKKNPVGRPKKKNPVGRPKKK